MRRHYWLLLAPLLLSGCAAAAVEAIAPEAVAATAEGTLAADAAGGMAAMRAGAAGMAEGAPMARMLVSDPLLPVAAQEGVLESGLRRITADGTRTAVLGVDGSGVIRAGLEPLAQIRGTTIFYGDRAVGELGGNIVYDLRGGSGRVAVAELDGVIPGRVLRAQRSVANGSSDLFVEVTEVRDGFYRVRLPDRELWVPAEFVALALLGTGIGDCSDQPGSLVRLSGETVRFERCRFDGDVYRLATAEGEMIVDRNQVRKIIPGDLAAAAVAPALTLKGGIAIFGRVDDAGDVLTVNLPTGGFMLVDRQQLESPISRDRHFAAATARSGDSPA